ncbi:MAG: ribosome silencing factor [Candidatus Fibromonas sp.]|jgi:ribosome-associated protein|nr:ribosome silencing factor [Candidatus Fibromonas sp.]
MKRFPASVKIGAQIMFELRAEKVELLDLRGLSSVVDWYLVGTCESSAQMQAILGELQKAYKTAGGEPASVEYKELTRWAVLDAGDIMVHLFEQSRREEIALDELWNRAKNIPLGESDFARQKTSSVQSGEFV